MPTHVPTPVSDRLYRLLQDRVAVKICCAIAFAAFYATQLGATTRAIEELSAAAVFTELHRL